MKALKDAVQSGDTVQAVNTVRPRARPSKPKYEKPKREQHKPCFKCGYAHERQRCPCIWSKMDKMSEVESFRENVSIEEVCMHDRQHMIDNTSDSGEPILGIKVDQLDRKLVAKVSISSSDATKQVSLHLDTAATCNM